MYFLDFQCFFASFGFFNFYQNMGQKLGSNKSCKKYKMEDTTLSRQRSEKHIDQGDMTSSAFSNRDNLCS